LTLPISETVKLYAGMAEKLEPGKRVSATFFFGSSARVIYEPVGLAGYILPWNFPFELGCASLLRDAGVPADLVQIVHGFAATGAAVVDEADVVCFVGSPATGRKIMARAARSLTPVVLELGGNDAAIVRADADLELTARGLVTGTCFNSGQVCNGIERIYVPRLVVVVRREGEALFWPPTLLTDMSQDMLMMQEETFGPFLPIMAVADDEEALALANDSRYELAASVWTRDRAAGLELARRMRAGSVMINNAVQSGGCVTLPFGGAGDSGVGRVQGEAGYFNYVSPKSLMTSPRSAANLWMPYGDGAEAMIAGLGRLLHGRSLRERLAGGFDFLRNLPRGGP